MNKGILSGIAAYAMWGFFPIYWKLLHDVPAVQLLGHRIGWSFLLLMAFIFITNQWKDFRTAAFNAKVLGIYAVAGVLLSLNWLIYVWGVNSGFIVETSLGYFINPLLNVLIGSFWLGESLSRLQKLSIASAAAGVAMQLVLVGRFPWIGLLLAGSFALYGLARRRSPLGSLPGLAMETIVGIPVALLYLIWSQQSGTAIWGTASARDLLLIFGLGIITTIPLLGFARGARELPFALLGVLQFLAPTGQFLVGSLVYGEPVNAASLVSFGLIWTGVALFCGNLFLHARRSQVKA